MLHFVNESFFSSETTWNNFQNTLTNRNKQKQRSLKQRSWLTKCVWGGASSINFVSNLFFAHEEVGACRSFRVQCRGLKFDVFLWHFRVSAGIKGKFKHFKRNFLISSTALGLNWLNIYQCWDTNLPFEVALIFGSGALMFQECALMWTLWIRLEHLPNVQLKKFLVSPFYLEMAASSTRAGELGLESQEEGLLAEKSETPRCCSAYLRGTAAKCLLAIIILWLSGMSITIFVLKLNWHILLRCLPGCGGGFLLVLMASYEMKRRESKDIKTRKLPGWAILALPHFLWLILLSVFEMTWQAFTLEMVGTALGCLGLCSWMADESEEDDWWRIAGWMLQISGLLVMWLGVLPCLVQITWQVAVCSLPGICCFLLSAFTEGVPRCTDVMAFIFIEFFLLYLMALPLSGLWQWFTGMELAAYSCCCIVLCQWIWFGNSMDEDDKEFLKFLVGCGVVMCCLPFGAFAWATKLSCNQVGPWCHCWPWVLFVPFALVSIYCTIEGVFLLWHRDVVLLWYRDKIRATRAAMLTRIIIIGTLALAPVLLATDVETWQEGVEAPSMNPMEYFDVSMENWTHPDIEVKRHQLHWLQMPQPIWPSSDDLANTSSRRTSFFWLSYMSFKFVLAAAMAFSVLKCHCASSKQSRDGADSQDTMEVQPLTKLEKEQGEKFDDRHRSAIFCAIFPIYLTLVIKVSCTAAVFGQLTAETGLAFEGYDLCLTCGLLWLFVQALALRASDFEAQYNATDILLSMSFLVPFIGVGFDSLKDSMLGALALRSQLVPLRCLGVFSLSYLVMFHIVLACNGSDRVQLEKAYLPILFLKQKPRSTTAEGSTPGFSRRKVLVLLYEQVKPSRQWAMLLEDLPQGMVALVVSSVEGFQGFTVIVNIGVPLFRISMAWLLHDWIASQLADWFLAEAMKASDAGQFALCDDFIAALHRLQRASFAKESDFTLWEHLRKKNERCCSEAVQKSQDDQSSISLRLFVALQLVGIDNESVLPPGLGLSAVMTFLESIREPQQRTKLVVHLDGEKIGFSGAQALGEQLSKFRHLTTLELRLFSNNLGSEGGKALGESLGKLQKITTLELRLDNNNLGSEGGKALGESLGKLQKITTLELWLGGNNLGPENGRALVEQLSKLQEITTMTLYLYSNNLGSEGGKALGESLGKLQKITTLVLGLESNNLGSEGGKALGESLGKLQKITTLELYLGSNNLGLEGARALVEQLGKFQQITTLKLSLSNNNLGPEGGKALGEALSKLQQITSLRLDLRSNKFGSEGAKALADHLSDLVHLTEVTLRLYDNGIDREVRDEIEWRLQRPGRRVEVVIWVLMMPRKACGFQFHRFGTTQCMTREFPGATGACF